MCEELRLDEKNVQQLLQSLDSKSVAAKSASGSPNGSISLAMKAKLQNAVRAMQEGLVERDTEVGSRGCVWQCV
jgi:hypothetical protein